MAEIYRGQDGSLFKIKRCSEHPEFFTFEIFSEEEANNLADFLLRNNKRRQKSTCLEGNNVVGSSRVDR